MGRISPVSKDSGISSTDDAAVDGVNDEFDVNVFLKKTLNHFERESLLRPDSSASASPVFSSIDSASSKTVDDGYPVSDRLVIPVEFGLHAAELTSSKGSLLSAALSTTAASDCGLHLCRICHQRHETAKDPMITPCRCSGTMQYVHTRCLVHWLEISTKKMCPSSQQCELCGYDYKHWHCLHLRSFHLPHVAGRDRVLNVICILVLFIMVICGGMSIYFLHMTDQYHTIRSYHRSNYTLMTQEDIVVIICSILFFIAFFIAVFTQYRAEASICRVFFRFWLINRNWRIRNYNPIDDPEMSSRSRRTTEENVVSRCELSTRRPLAAEFCLI